MRLRHFTLFFGIVAFASCSVFKHTGKKGPLVETNKEAPPAELIAKIPFVQFTGGVVVVQAKINNNPDTLNFILDSGSGGISLDSTTCIQLGLKAHPSDEFIRGIGGIKPLFFAGENTLVLPGLRVDSLDFHISNYDFISSVYGVKIDGIIGYSFLKRYIVQVNYDSMKLFVYTPGHFRYGRGGELLHPFIHNIPVINAPIWNKKIVHTRYYFDMGAGLCLMLSDQFIKDSCLFCKPNQRRHKFVKSEAQGLSGKIVMTQTVIQGLKVGKYYFHNVPTYLFDDVSNVTAYPFLGGLIGNDLLRRFNVTLNYPDDQIYLEPNSHFLDPFDYSYTGMDMYFIDGHVVITDVTKGSPADKAGIKPGDEVLAVNTNFSNNIQKYRELLKATGSRIHLIILRDGKIHDIRLLIKSIL
ncbi:MAG: PDZ domain-containing protein [Chitinophagaceae bacterium]